MKLDNEEALNFLRSLEHAEQKEISDYLSTALDRLGATFALIPDDLPSQAKVLEIGAMPYYHDSVASSLHQLCSVPN